MYSFATLWVAHYNGLLSGCAACSHITGQFSDCIMIGRDLIRLLQNVSRSVNRVISKSSCIYCIIYCRVPGFTELWLDMMNKPEKLAPGFTG